MATTHQDTNVNQLVINKMTKQEYDNLQQVSDTELYLVEEQVDSVVTENSTNPVQSGAVYEALQQSSSNINDGTTTFTKNNETIGSTSANQSENKTISLPNDVIMCKMSDGLVYDSYITYTKVKQYLPDYPYYSDDLDWEIGGNPPMRANITADNYYLDIDTKHIFVADENLELLDITSSVVIHGDSNKLYCNITDNKVYRYNGSTFVPLSNDIVDNLIISNNLAYPLEGTYIGQVESTEPPIFYDRKAADFHTFVSQDNGKYFYDDIDNKVYIYIEQPNPHLYCVSDNELYYLENLDTTKTYLSYKTDKLYRTNNGENFNLIATIDYIDLKNKPLSVESNKVKYTLSDGTTKLTLAQESELATVAKTGNFNDLSNKEAGSASVTFTSSTVFGNIVSGETLAVMMKKIYRKERYLSCELPYLQYSDLPSQSTNTETACKEWLQYIVTNHWSEIQDNVLYFAPFTPNSRGFVVGYFYAADTPNAQHFPSYCSFILLGINSSTLFQKFGTNNYTFYFKSLTI